MTNDARSSAPDGGDGAPYRPSPPAQVPDQPDCPDVGGPSGPSTHVVESRGFGYEALAAAVVEWRLHLCALAVHPDQSHGMALLDLSEEMGAVLAATASRPSDGQAARSSLADAG